MADVYPTSPRQKGEFDRLALSTWDNEGGSMAKAGPLRSTTARSGQP
jgi:hypothetical protein